VRGVILQEAQIGTPKQISATSEPRKKMNAPVEKQHFIAWTVAIVNALVFTALGVYFFFYAREGLNPVDLNAESSKGTVEIRAMYGGLEFGIGMLFCYWLIRRKLRAVCLASTFMMAGLLTGRLLGMLIDQQGGIHWMLASVEATTIVLNAVAIATSLRKSATKKI